MKRDPFPLQWPDNTPRMPPASRVRSRFGHRGSGQVSFSIARKELLDELNRLLGTVNVAITSDLPTRGDGLPYANGRADDVGIAVWFTRDGSELVLACDMYRSHAENMTAIARTIEAMRGIERWGVADAVNRAFAGFTALPPGSSGTIDNAPIARPWREVLDISPAVSTLHIADQLVLARSRHRTLIKTAHPDAGGSHELAAELNAALAAAEAELDG